MAAKGRIAVRAKAAARPVTMAAKPRMTAKARAAARPTEAKAKFETSLSGVGDSMPRLPMGFGHIWQ
jgi:hypothetical protein